MITWKGPASTLSLLHRNSSQAAGRDTCTVITDSLVVCGKPPAFHDPFPGVIILSPTVMLHIVFGERLAKNAPQEECKRGKPTVQLGSKAILGRR